MMYKFTVIRWFAAIFRWFAVCLILAGCSARQEKKVPHGKLYEYSGSTPRWSSPENLNGQKGKGAMENHGAKGHAYSPIPKGASLSLLDIRGQGIISRIWITINDRSPGMLRSLKLEMFWDNETKAAVSVPLGDFFGMGLGRMTAFHNVFFADPEGRSFNCLIPMPFKTGARIVVTNESDKDLEMMFFDVDYRLTEDWDQDNLYFHAFWHRDTATTLGKDFELLPRVQGKGRYLGTNVGVNTNPRYKDLWWGEGEVKMYLDGDADFPTLAGTGTEDYIGTGWGQGKFFTDYTGCLIADGENHQWGFYRYHVPDPIYFSSDCRVTIQQMGGGPPKEVDEVQKAGVPLTIATTSEAWNNFFRSDDVSATAYFYLDKPSDGLSSLQSVNMRTYNLK
ncbi:MAG TPA: glycoside hydrolase family 172 protein [Puia sp.]|nr:glycoside hydrolase family 172 protein [Puia sp.]